MVINIINMIKIFEIHGKFMTNVGFILKPTNNGLLVKFWKLRLKKEKNGY